MNLTPAIRDTSPGPVPSVAATRVSAAPRAAAAAAPASPAAAPASLWDALTVEERAFFLQAADLGPLTYAPGAGAAADPGEPAPRGQRIDLRA